MKLINITFPKVLFFIFGIILALNLTLGHQEDIAIVTYLLELSKIPNGNLSGNGLLIWILILILIISNSFNHLMGWKNGRYEDGFGYQSYSSDHFLFNLFGWSRDPEDNYHMRTY